MKFLKVGFVIFGMAFLASIPSAFSCDLCSIYIASQAEGKSAQGLTVSGAEQFTHFSTLQKDGVNVPNEVGQYLDSSISQFMFSYPVTGNLRLQLNIPYIHRVFRRPENFRNGSGEGTNIVHGAESGLGDVSLIGNFTVYRGGAEDFAFVWQWVGGMKFPTGNTSRLGEELNEIDVEGAPESGIHGHDLTLGSGSFDGMVGTYASVRWKGFFLDANVQYSIRTKGDFYYQFANDLAWSGGPGGYLFLEHEFTVAFQAHVSGGSKGEDSFQNQRTSDTTITAVYLGPRFIGTWRDCLSADLGVDFPLSIDNTGFQAVPDYRVQAAISWHF